MNNMREDDTIHALMQFFVNVKASGYKIKKADEEAINDSVSALQKIIRLKDTVEGTIDHLDLDDAMDMLYDIKAELAVR